MTFPIVSRTVLAVLATVLLAACATPMKMPVAKDTPAVDVSSKSLLLMTLRMSHDAKPSITPFPRVAHVEKPGATKQEDRLNFMFDADATSVGPDGEDYLVRVDLEPGQYSFHGFSGGGGMAIFPGYFALPILADIEVEPNTVVYLGRIEARTRERVGNEFRAGPVAPLLDQAVTGWSTSTWEVEVRDAYESDIARFRTHFPALAETEVRKQVLPAFDREKTQKWWDAQ